MATDAAPGLAAIGDAAARIAPFAHVTPVLRSASLDERAGCEVHFKCENFQRVGAFKFRGACNAVFALPDDIAARGVATHSSGNHGAALALAARLRGIPAHVVVPTNAAKVKHDAIARHGAKIVECAPSMAAREAAVAQVIAHTGATLVHPFADPLVIAGQGTVALELLRQCAGLDALIAPIGGGGLLSGCAITARAIAPAIGLWGAEPAAACDAHDSLAQGRLIDDRVPDTLCDGLRGHLAPITFAILRTHLDGIGLASEQEIVAAMRLLWERLKIIVEPSSAVTLAALLRERERFAGQRVGLVLTGGNVDLDTLAWQR
ncbi:MAG: pyridoxal-phosphate dependent enzyme [Proteobacteria bacterium]|nr:pyridoxal-phosphate dependent enzyme [Pseudomonadota bacterium]MBS0464611.1 pyridoxal-phosphate dependent enzyme [Pseudomonadota bacterium]